MNKVKIFFFLSFTIMLAFVSHNAKAFDCKGSEPTVNVNIDTGQVVYDFDRDRKYISNVFNKDNGKSGLSHHTAGLTAAIFKSQITGSVKLISVGSRTCVQLETVDIYLGYGDIIVYVDKDYPKGSCMFDAILRHENTHVNIHQTFLAHYSDYLKKMAEYHANKQESVWVRSMKEAKKVRNKMVQNIMDGLIPAIKVYTTARDNENQNLDTTDNYFYTQQQCEQW